jgi:hypothetical protein
MYCIGQKTVEPPIIVLLFDKDLWLIIIINLRALAATANL